MAETGKGDSKGRGAKSRQGATSEAAKTPKAINCQLPGAELLEQGKSVEEVMAELERQSGDDISPEHDRFCREYIIDDNQTRAYMRAYPNSSYGAAAVSAYHLLKNPKVCQRIDTLRSERNRRLEVRADKVLRRLEARASFNMRDLYRPDGSFIPLHELDPDISIGIKSVKVAELYEGQGETKQAVGVIREITCFDGKASDELIGRNLKLWKDVGSAENPITSLTEDEINAQLAALERKNHT